MKAVIVAAGRGLRLANENSTFTYFPKCLAKIGKKSVLEHQMDVLRQFNFINSISIVIGKKGKCWNNNRSYELIRAICEKEKIKMIQNDENETTQSSYSLFLAINNMEPSRLLSIDGDMFFTKEILSSILNNSHDNIILCYRTSNLSNSGTRVLVDEDGLVKSIGKTWEIPATALSWLMHNGITMIGANHFVHFKKILISGLETNRNHDLSYPLRLFSKKHSLYALEINHGHVNINTQYDLRRACAMYQIDRRS